MGKRASKELDPNNGHTTVETIRDVEIVSLAILILLVAHWTRKWFAKRKTKKTTRQREQMALAVRSTKDIESQPIRNIHTHPTV